jgi:hypothetical protein
MLAVFFVGCGDDNPLGRQAVSGKVTLDGGPLDLGNIEFHPLDGGAPSGGSITQGSYSIAEHEGLPPGKYRVAIRDFVPPPEMPPGHSPGMPLPPSPPAKVPAEWNSKSEHTVEVTKEGPFTFDFDIATKKK